MCTVSVVPTNGGFRLACNRDERRTRPPAEAPAVRAAASSLAIWPFDPLSRGTWIGVNDSGLALVLLNRKGHSRQTHSMMRSRGTIIPSLLECSRLADAIGAAMRLPLLEFEPFTLVALQTRDGISITTSGERPQLHTFELCHPRLFTSSSLGDEIATPPRRRLFAALVEESASLVQGQDAFHRHTWPDRPDVSVRMCRADAATVSITVVQASGDRVHMAYTPVSH